MSDVWLPSNFDRVLICQFVINLLCWIAVLKMFSISRELQLQTVGLTMMKWDRTYFDDHCQCTLMEAHTDTSEQCWDRKCGELLICWNSNNYFWSYDSRSAPLHDPKVQIEPQLLWYLIDCFSFLSRNPTRKKVLRGAASNPYVWGPSSDLCHLSSH